MICRLSPNNRWWHMRMVTEVWWAQITTNLHIRYCSKMEEQISNLIILGQHLLTAIIRELTVSINRFRTSWYRRATRDRTSQIIIIPVGIPWPTPRTGLESTIIQRRRGTMRDGHTHKSRYLTQRLAILLLKTSYLTAHKVAIAPIRHHLREARLRTTKRQLVLTKWRAR